MKSMKRSIDGLSTEIKVSASSAGRLGHQLAFTIFWDGEGYILPTTLDTGKTCVVLTQSGNAYSVSIIIPLDTPPHPDGGNKNSDSFESCESDSGINIRGYLWTTNAGSYESGSNVHAVVREGEELRVYSRGGAKE